METQGVLEEDEGFGPQELGGGRFGSSQQHRKNGRKDQGVPLQRHRKKHWSNFAFLVREEALEERLEKLA